MGHHIDSEGRFQSDKYPDLRPDKIVISFKHPQAWGALAYIASGYATIDPELAADMRQRLASIAGAEWPTIQRRIEIGAAISRERAYQDVKHGSLTDHPHTVAEWLLVMRKELREAEDAWVCGNGDAGALEEILQAIATGVACLEQHGVVESPARSLAVMAAKEARAKGEAA